MHVYVWCECMFKCVFCMYVGTCVYRYVCVCVHACTGRPKVDFWILSPSIWPYFLRQVLSLTPKLTNPSLPWGVSLSLCVVMISSHHGCSASPWFWRSEIWSSHFCDERFSTELSPKSRAFISNTFLLCLCMVPPHHSVSQTAPGCGSS